MINVGVMGYLQHVEDMEVQHFNNIRDSLKDDIHDLVQQIHRLVPGITHEVEMHGDVRWVIFRLPEYVLDSRVKAQQYLVLNECMRFDKKLKEDRS